MNYLKKPNSSRFFLIYGVLALIVGSFAGFFFSHLTVSAQTFEQNITLSLSPQTPKPNEEVLVRIEGFSTDLSRARVRWFVNGSLYESGVGLREVVIQTGAVGKEVGVSTQVTTQEGRVLNESLSLTPAEVFLVWESNTYTPPFYKGKALLTSDNVVKITALPRLSSNGSTFLNPQELVYTWSKNGRILGSLSGFGKQTLTLAGPSLFQEMDISVEVASFGGSLRAQESITLSPQEPELVVYEEDPLRGVLYERALEEEFSFEGDEVGLWVEPYFFNKEDVPKNLLFVWSLNRQTIQGAEGRNITFTRPEGRGVSIVGLRAINENSFLQEAQTSLRVLFGEASRFE